MKQITRIVQLAIFSVYLASQTISASPLRENDDFDSDDDGLIDIYDVQDLKEISRRSQYQQNKTLYDSDTGCPSSGCFGFELMNDIDFDENQNGEIENNEQYFPGAPIFNAVIEGNHFKVLNMVTVGTDYPGLFQYLESSIIRNLEISGPLTFTRGESVSGLLASNVRNSVIENCKVKGLINSANSAGAFSGNLYSSLIINSHAEADVFGIDGAVQGSELSGLVGILKKSKIISSTFTGNIAGINGGAAFTARPGSESEILYSVANILSSDVLYDFNYPRLGYRGIGNLIIDHQESSVIAMADFQQGAGQHEDDNTYITIDGLDSLTAAIEPLQVPINDFGQTVAFFNARDKQGHLVWDISGQWPQPYPNLDFEISGFDFDEDGVDYPEDAFPFHPEVSLDADKDAIPDAWNEACDLSCQQNSGFVLDDDFSSNPEENEDSAEVSAGTIGFVQLLLLSFLLTGLKLLRTPKRSL